MAEIQRLISAKDMAEALHQSGAVRVGKTKEEFPMTNGGKTGVKWDVEQVEQYPDSHQLTVLKAYEDTLYALMIRHRPRIDRLVGVPNGMNRCTSLLAKRMNIGQILLDKAEVQAGNTQIRGDYTAGHVYDIELAEDVLTTGKSVFESAAALVGHGHRIAGGIALITRNERAVETLTDKLKEPVHAIYTSVELAQELLINGAISEEQLSWIEDDFKKPIPTY